MAAKTGIERAVKMHGTQILFAEQLSIEIGDKISQPTISQWITKGYVPAKRAKAVSAITDIPISELTRKNKRSRRTRGRQTNETVEQH